ncbi:hypothetical protein GCM10027515_06080 [Schumannella luteola]|uniref:FtsH-binding integral membrane protein n=1 Tax=Schumannella luteola TaxID=472059 RepID=A0A852YA77_9MICO|nr:hypothetical protein [Schumannella luteola]NYG98260.1 FtsH-binding integral membrane protein [Schumannella luteola]TPX05703.1 hypothetical protein FJ656_04485 [Schumannella luteola]
MTDPTQPPRSYPAPDAFSGSPGSNGGGPIPAPAGPLWRRVLAGVVIVLGSTVVLPWLVLGPGVAREFAVDAGFVRTWLLLGVVGAVLILAGLLISPAGLGRRVFAIAALVVAAALATVFGGVLQQNVRMAAALAVLVAGGLIVVGVFRVFGVRGAGWLLALLLIGPVLGVVIAPNAAVLVAAPAFVGVVVALGWLVGHLMNRPRALTAAPMR